MITTSPEKLVRLMNECGALNKPFVFAVDFEMTEGLFSDEPFTDPDIFFTVHGRGSQRKRPFPVESALFSSYPCPYDEYLEKFMVVRNGLLRGDSFLVNLTVKTPIQCSLSLEDIFTLSDAPYTLFVPGRFACFSPETFVKMAGNSISTYPMKGTIGAEIPGAADIILNDFKESAEHATIVDLLRNDLSILSDDVEVSRYRYIDHLVTSEREILQVSSEIKGTLRPGWQGEIGDILFSMLPAGSCSGAPKASTLRIIERAEREPRGFYTGIFGLFDGRSLDSGVLIRFIEIDGDDMFFRSGGGITAYSKPHDEYLEASEKIYLPFARALRQKVS
ncbi:MAG: aminodeoxychorismate synthase component I [Deltaproteobacteria bacterium]|jgi:para-aminobenzoate synthetase component 1|nr:aminodeoxychorismate synthase component I [Deltaproteobacteria bacterium]